VVWYLVVRRKAACLVVESCKSGRKERSATSEREAVANGPVANGGEGQKVNTWEGEAVEQASIQ
jgi:hypothetical protein